MLHMTCTQKWLQLHYVWKKLKLIRRSVVSTYLIAIPIVGREFEQDHSIYIRTVSSECPLSALLSGLNWFMGRLGRVPCTVHSFLPRPPRKNSNVPRLKSNNLQYNMLVRWADGPNDWSTQWGTFQLFFFFIISYRLRAFKTCYFCFHNL